MDEIIVEQKDCIVIGIRLDDIQMQIRRILLQERRRIRKRSRKQINAKDDVNPRVLTMLAIINLNLHISIRKLQCNLRIPYVTVWRILQRHKFHPYHITLTQDVSENDMKLKSNFVVGHHK